jgi:hypothetical protein
MTEWRSPVCIYPSTMLSTSRNSPLWLPSDVAHCQPNMATNGPNGFSDDVTRSKSDAEDADMDMDNDGVMGQYRQVCFRIEFESYNDWCSWTDGCAAHVDGDVKPNVGDEDGGVGITNG